MSHSISARQLTESLNLVMTEHKALDGHLWLEWVWICLIMKQAHRYPAEVP